MHFEYHMEDCCIFSLIFYFSKGSLTDILNNDDVNLPWIFKYSLLKVFFIILALSCMKKSSIGVPCILY